MQARPPCHCSQHAQGHGPAVSGPSVLALKTRRAHGRPDRLSVVAYGAERQKDSPLVVGLVSVMTESLRVLGVGKDRYQEVLQSSQPVRRLRRGDVQGVIRGIKKDFQQGYIITGIISDDIYDEDCFFADPTVSFSGLQLWKRNLQLLVPFLIEPQLDLVNISRTGRDTEGRETLLAEWRLSTYLRLPWTPLISILGKTAYTLNEDSNTVVEHVESWDVTGLQALAQMFKPSGYKPSNS